MKYCGPTVICTDVDDFADTHSPYPEGPWHCMNCGSTEHKEVPE